MITATRASAVFFISAEISLPVSSISRRSSSPFSFIAVTILLPFASSVVLSALNPSNIVVLSVPRLVFTLVSCASSVLSKSSILTDTSANPALVIIVNASNFSDKVAVKLLIVSTNLVADFSICAEISLPVSSISRRNSSPFSLIAYTICFPVSSICVLNAEKPSNRVLLIDDKPFSTFSPRILIAPVFSSTDNLISAKFLSRSLFNASNLSLIDLLRSFITDTRAE